MKKRVVFITNRLIGGGSERVLVTLANKFVSMNHDVYIISYKNGETYRLDSKIKVITLEKINSKILRIFKIRHIIKENQFDIIIAFEYFVNMQTIISSFGLNSRIIISERNDPSRRGNKFPMRLIRNLLYRFSDILVCQTEDAKNYFPNYIRKKTSVIGNAIKPDLPSPWYGERQKAIISFCRLEKQKNITLLIDSFIIFHALHPEYFLIVYGDGSERVYLQRYIQNKNAESYISLRNSVDDIHEKAKVCEMFVSSSDYEGMSNSLLESMAIGLPVIATDCPCGGARTLIKDKFNGLLVPVRNKEAMVEAMCAIVENEELREEISKNAYLVNQEYNVDTIYNKWATLMNEVDNFDIRS